MLRRKQRGAAIVEGALVMLVTFTMTLFIIDMGRFLLIQEFITDRARVTVRQAAVNNWTATQVQNFFVYNSPNAASSTAPGRLGLLPSQVSYTTLGSTGAADYRLQVRVSRVPAFLFVPYLHGRFSLPTVIATAPAESLGATQ
jgi:Flp pilus assembly protein TadG